MPGTRPPIASRHGSALVGRDHFVIGEHDGTLGQFRAIGGLESLHRIGARMHGMGGLIGENEEMHKAGRIVLLLPGNIKLRAGLLGFDVGDKFGDGAFHLVHTGRFHAVGCDRLNRHAFSPGFEKFGWWQGGHGAVAKRPRSSRGEAPELGRIQFSGRLRRSRLACSPYSPLAFWLLAISHSGLAGPLWDFTMRRVNAAGLGSRGYGSTGDPSGNAMPFSEAALRRISG